MVMVVPSLAAQGRASGGAPGLCGTILLSKYEALMADPDSVLAWGRVGRRLTSIRCYQHASLRER
jgi:hypothetical protein